MPAPRGRKRKSDGSTASIEAQNASEMATHKVPTKSGSSDAHPSPLKKRKVGISLAQKQALIDNLQLEITERARKLRANYNIHAQSLRTRVEIRVNRIPVSLRKAKMGDLLLRFSKEQQQKIATAALASKPPPVPAKDPIPARVLVQPVAAPTSAPAPAAAAPVPLSRPAKRAKRTSDVMLNGDKENEFDLNGKRPRAIPSNETIRDLSQVLSPTSSNTRVIPRDRVAASPGKSLIARPVSPMKTSSAINLFSSMVEKARSTRAGANVRKATSASTASSSNGSAAATAARARKGATAGAPAPPRNAPSRTARRASGVSESSYGSTSTVVRKPATARAPVPKAATASTAAKKTVMSTIKKGVAATTATKKAEAAKGAPITGTGRVLRKRT